LGFDAAEQNAKSGFIDTTSDKVNSTACLVGKSSFHQHVGMGLENQQAGWNYILECFFSALFD
jgi:hypothetical protein